MDTRMEGNSLSRGFVMGGRSRCSWHCAEGGGGGGEIKGGGEV